MLQIDTEVTDLKALDDAMLARMAGYNSDALAELFNRHRHVVASTCYRVLKDWDDAQEVAQDVWIQVHNNIVGFRGGSTFSSWLYAIARNQALMRVRKCSYKRERTIGREPLEEYSPLEPRHDPRLVEHMIVEEYVNKLAPGYRQVFILHDLEGCEHEEIGKRLGISPGTSKSQLHKARHKMREFFKEKKVWDSSEASVKD